MKFTTCCFEKIKTDDEKRPDKNKCDGCGSESRAAILVSDDLITGLNNTTQEYAEAYVGFLLKNMVNPHAGKIKPTEGAEEIKAALKKQHKFFARVMAIAGRDHVCNDEVIRLKARIKKLKQADRKFKAYVLKAIEKTPNAKDTVSYGLCGCGHPYFQHRPKYKNNTTSPYLFSCPIKTCGCLIGVAYADGKTKNKP